MFTTAPSRSSQHPEVTEQTAPPRVSLCDTGRASVCLAPGRRPRNHTDKLQMPHKLRPIVLCRPKAAGRPGSAGGPRAATCARAGCAVAAAAAATLLTPPPAAAAAANLTLAPSARTALAGCDSPTPVRAPGGAIYSNVSDCSVGGSGRVSTGWVRLEPSVQWVPSGLTEHGSGASGRKVSGAVVEGGTVYVIERNLTKSGGMRVGWSANFGGSNPSWSWPSWTITDFGWGSFAQASPHGYGDVHLRDRKSAHRSGPPRPGARGGKGDPGRLGGWH